MELESGPLKPLCTCGDRAVTTLGRIPMCRICLSNALHREATEAEEVADAEERGETPARPAFRPRRNAP